MPNFFPWNQKQNKQSPSRAAVSSIPCSERRRAVRIDEPKISLTLKLSRRQYSSPKVVDMSTLGIGVILDEDPEDQHAALEFQAPPLLAGMKILAKKRHVAKAASEGESKYAVGYEFSFTSKEQQTLLLRWLASQLLSGSESESGKQAAKDKAKASSYSSSFYSNLDGGLEIRFPETREEFEQALELITPLKTHHALLQTRLFTVFRNQAAAAVIPLVADTLPFKLPADDLFPEYLAGLRSAGERLGEICPPYFEEDLHFLKNPSSAHLRKLRILFSVYPYILSFAANFERLTSIVAAVPSHLEEFFHLWLFKEIGPLGETLGKRPGQVRKGFRLFSLNLKTLDRELTSERPELSAAFHKLTSSSESLAPFENSHFPDAATFKKWFVRRSPVLHRLTKDQTEYFHSLLPDLKL